MKRLTLPLVALAALLLAAPALAKEPKEATVCGADGCATTTDRQSLLNLMVDNGTLPPAPPAGEYYKVTITIDVPPDAGVAPKVGWWYAPSGGGAIRAIGRDPSGVTPWYALTSGGKALFDKVTGDLRPFSSPKVTGVTIGGKAVEDPASYVRLLSLPTSVDAVPRSGDWQQVVFGGPPSPWTDNAVDVSYSPKDNLLQRGADFVRIAPATAAKIESGSSLAPGGGFPWRPVSFGLVAVLLLAALVLTARRIRGLPGLGRRPAGSEG